MKKVLRQHGIKTVIQLNGTSYRDLAGNDMILEHREGYTHCRLRWSSESEPGTREARSLLRAIEQNEAPYLIQCRNGANRSAGAAALARILLGDASLTDTRGYRLGTADFPSRRIGVAESVDFLIPLQLRDGDGVLALTIKVTGEAWFHQRNDEFFKVPLPDISKVPRGSGVLE